MSFFFCRNAVIDGMFIASMSGLTWFNIPAFAFKTFDGRRALAYNQLAPLSEAGLQKVCVLFCIAYHLLLLSSLEACISRNGLLVD